MVQYYQSFLALAVLKINSHKKAAYFLFFIFILKENAWRIGSEVNRYVTLTVLKTDLIIFEP